MRLWRLPTDVWMPWKMYGDQNCVESCFHQHLWLGVGHFAQNSWGHRIHYKGTGWNGKRRVHTVTGIWFGLVWSFITSIRRFLSVKKLKEKKEKAIALKAKGRFFPNCLKLLSYFLVLFYGFLSQRQKLQGLTVEVISQQKVRLMAMTMQRMRMLLTGRVHP